MLTLKQISLGLLHPEVFDWLDEHLAIKTDPPRSSVTDAHAKKSLNYSKQFHN